MRGFWPIRYIMTCRPYFNILNLDKHKTTKCKKTRLLFLCTGFMYCCRWCNLYTVLKHVIGSRTLRSHCCQVTTARFSSTHHHPVVVFSNPKKKQLNYFSLQVQNPRARGCKTWTLQLATPSTRPSVHLSEPFWGLRSSIIQRTWQTLFMKSKLKAVTWNENFSLSKFHGRVPTTLLREIEMKSSFYIRDCHREQ